MVYNVQMGTLQTWLLYHNALSAGVVIEDVLKYARKSRERADDEGEMSVAELRAQLAHQDQMIQMLIQANPSLTIGSSGGGGQRKGQSGKGGYSGSAAEAIPITREVSGSMNAVSSAEKRNYGSLTVETQPVQVRLALLCSLAATCNLLIVSIIAE
jgi:hypothetical protein